MQSMWSWTLSSGLLTVLGAALFLTSFARAAHQLTPEDIEDIADFVERTRQCRDTPGLTLSIVQDGKVVMARGFGVTDIDSGEKVTANTPFPIGSTSKGFVSALLAIQLAEGKKGIDWDTPLHCLPKSTIAFSDDLRTSQANLRDILAHKMGLPGYLWTLLTGVPESVTRDEMVRRIKFMEPVLPFRTGFLYNNFMYGLAAHVSELLSDTDEDWEMLNKKKLFDPAGMTSSGYIDKTPNPPGLALPYTVIGKATYKIDPEATRFVHPLGPAGSIFSTAEDMSKWIQLHLAVLSRMQPSSGPALPFPGNLTLTDAAVKKIWETYQSLNAEPIVTPQFTKPDFPVVDIHLSYGMGWFNGIYRGYRRLYHGGSVSSYSSLTQLLPDLRSGIFVSDSGRGGFFGSSTSRIIAAYITDKLTGETPWINSSTTCTYPAPWLKFPSPPPADYKPEVTPLAPALSSDDVQQHGAESFTGTYGHRALGEMTVYIETDGLHLKYGRFGHALLAPTTVPGLFEASLLGKLWFVSSEMGLKMKLQFISISSGKTQELIAAVDPMVVATFSRDLDMNKVPSIRRRCESLMDCPGRESCPRYVWG